MASEVSVSSFRVMVELRDGQEVKEMLRRFVQNEEYVSFVAEKMEQSVFRTVRSESLVALLQ